MTGYLVRRFLQMALVVFLSTAAIYALLNVAPGGPLAGLRMTADRRQQVSDVDVRRLQSYLGIDKPLILRYFVWLLGDDWLGADWMSLEPGGYQGEGDQVHRFWADPGVAHLKPGYVIRVRGEEVEPGVLQASYIESRPSGARPEGMVELTVVELWGSEFRAERFGGARLIVRTTAETEFVTPGALPRPEEGAWIDIGWLFNPYRGLLGQFAGYHGDRRGVMRLDWGTSWKVAKGLPVLRLVESRLGNTLLLMSLSVAISLLVAIPIGILSAVKQYSLLDYITTNFSFFGSSMPVFWFGLMMILLFSLKFQEWGLPFMPSGGVTMDRRAPVGQVLYYLNAAPGGLVDRAVHLIMPATVLSLLYMAGWSRFTRSSMLEVLRQDYVRTARAKGLREHIVLGKHALRNAMIPLITVVVLQLPGIFGGATITEGVFVYQGIGQLYWQALVQDDWPVAMALLLITSILVVLSTLLGDILYTLVDPRIRLG